MFFSDCPPERLNKFILLWWLAVTRKIVTPIYWQFIIYCRPHPILSTLCGLTLLFLKKPILLSEIKEIDMQCMKRYVV